MVIGTLSHLALQMQHSEQPYMSSMPLVISDYAELDTQMRSAGAEKKLLLVRFTADWCPLCVHAKEEVEACEKAFNVRVATVDVGTSLELAEQLQVAKLPRVMIYFDSKQVADVIGRSEGAVTDVCKKFVFSNGVAQDEDF